MKQTINTNTVKTMNFDENGKLYISQFLQDQIDILHNEVGATEWSGVLFYSVQEGDINLKDYTILAEAVYPMDIGTSSYTEFDYTGKLFNAFDLIPGLEERYLNREVFAGLLHTH